MKVVEILPIGEKIKRARIYKGLKLKDICENKISVSKMSCIENGKVRAEDWIIGFVAKKLDLSVEYLKQDVDYQIQHNIKNECTNNQAEDKEDALKYNLKYAEEYRYYDIAFQLMHLLFKYYIDNSNGKACLTYTPKYYNLLIKTNSIENKYIYYMDIGRYFCIINEYSQAINYFKMVRNDSENKKLIDYTKLASVVCEEVYCYYVLEDFENAYNIAKQFTEQDHFVIDNNYKARLYKLLGILSIKLNNDEFTKYEKISYGLCNKNLVLRAEIMYSFGKVMLETHNDKQAYSYIKQAIQTYPQDEDKRGFVKLMINVAENLLKMNKRKKAEELSDIVLNYAIDMKDNIYIEKAYYIKALLITKRKDDLMKEMYMNLSLDLLLKIGNKKQIYKRYMEMGEMYFCMKNTNEALKYFGLAINLAKTI